jgi:hypothetical protein
MSAAALGACIDRLLQDPSFQDNSKRMSQIFVAIEQRSPACELIESTLAGRTLPV